MKRLFWICVILFIGYILASLFGCGQKQWKQRGLKHGWMDTTTHNNNLSVPPDTIVRDSLIKIFVTRYDTLKTVEQKTKYIKEFIEKYNEQVYPDTVVSFADGSKVRIWFENGILKGALVYQKTDIKELPKTWWEEWRDWIYGFFALLILFLLVIRRK